MEYLGRNGIKYSTVIIVGMNGKFFVRKNNKFYSLDETHIQTYYWNLLKIAICTMPYKQMLHYGCNLLRGWVCLWGLFSVWIRWLSCWIIFVSIMKNNSFRFCYILIYVYITFITKYPSASILKSGGVVPVEYTK